MDDEKLEKAQELKKQIDIFAEDLAALKRHETLDHYDHCTGVSFTFYATSPTRKGEVDKVVVYIKREDIKDGFDSCIAVMTALLEKKLVSLRKEYEAL